MEKEREKEIRKKLAEKFNKNNFLIVILVGILLLVIVWPVKDDSENSEKNINSEIQSGQLDSKKDIISLQSDFTQNNDEKSREDKEEMYAYASYLETSLEEMLSTMDGVGKVRVMITLENLGEMIIEKDKNTVRNSTTEVDSAGGSRNTTDFNDAEETVYGENNSPYISKMLTPSIQGVVVSAQGGGNEKTAENISEAIQALFGIEAHKIKVVKMISQ